MVASAPTSNRQMPQIPSVPRRPLARPSETHRVLDARPFPSAPPAPVLRAALWLHRSLQALVDRVVPANVAVFQRSVGVIQTALLGAVARYGVADILSAGPLTGDELAARTGTSPDAMHRTLRGLASLGIFVLREDGRFENNRLSRALIGGQVTRTKEWVQYCASQSNVTAWADFERTLVSGDNAFDRVFGMGVWDWFDCHPDEREMFAQAMMGLTVADAPVVAGLYPFGEIETLCDVGGGRGTLLSEILLRHPHLKGVLCDGAGVLESAKPLLEGRGVSARVKLAPANFFESVPSGADAYLLKNILHDWDDARCKVILGNVRGAMKPGQRVLLVEMIVPKNDSTSLGAVADLQMMVVCGNGRERSREELQALLESTGFAPGRVFSSPTVGVVEGRAV